jgi:hypothetical protein
MLDDIYGQKERGIEGPLFESDPFGESTAEPSAEENLVARLIWKHRGRRNPISIARLRENTGYSERQIKGIVESLVVNYGIRIGAKREEPAGYFVIEDAEDLAVAVGPYKAQIQAMLRRLRALEPSIAVREFIEQLEA